MEKLEKFSNKFSRSLGALKRNLDFFSKQTRELDPIEEESKVAGTIKLLELCYEMSWKFLQQYLKQKHSIELSSPKGIFRECYAQKIIDFSTTEQLLGISEARNATTHDYNEESAQEMYQRITEYYYILKSIELSLMQEKGKSTHASGSFAGR